MASQSPLIDEPLRVAGQTLDEEISWWLTDGFIGYFVAATVFVAMATMEWFGYITHAPRQPGLLSICAACAIVVLTARVFYVRSRIRTLRLGRNGERVVGQYLEAFCARGGRVFHDVAADVRGEKFNVDHVLICPHGIYAIETKTWSKPWPGAKVVSRNGKLLKAGLQPDRDPCNQAFNSARWLQELLERKTGMTCPVRPVVAIPGWCVDRGLEHGTVCVTEPKDFPKYIRNRSISLDRAEIRLLSAHLSRHIRAAQRNAHKQI